MYPDLSNYVATIPSGQAVSAALELRDQPVVAIQTDSAWTAAALCLDASFDGTTWGPIYNGQGDEIALTIPAAAHAFVCLSPYDLSGVRYLRLRSGLTGAAVNQGAARSLTVVARRL